MVALFPEDKTELVDKALQEYFPAENTYPQILYRAMRYSLFAGGKRFRPVLVLCVAEAFRGDAKTVMPAACSIEYIHTYSLIHDDLPAIDDDDLRRGRPTCHKAYGVDIAIMAGDALFAEAFVLLSKLQEGAQSGKIIKVIKEIAEASGAGGMVGGQVVDMESTGKQIDFETIVYIHTHKTGRLIRAAAKTGALLAGAKTAEIQKIAEYANHLGLGFQITDDILDEIGTEEELGKIPGADIKQNKATFPSILGLDEARARAEDEIKRAKDALVGLDCETTELENLADFVLERTG